MAFNKNDNLSYFIGADADETNPQMFLLGDHAMGDGKAGDTSTAADASVAANVYKNRAIALGTNTTATGMKAAWFDNSQHGKNANVALGDGSVQALSISKLREALRNSGDANNRLLFP